MRKFLKVYLPGLSIAFTFIVLYSSIYNVLGGYTKDGFCIFILEVMAYLIISMLIDYLVSLINFSRFIIHFIIETFLLYPVTLGMAIMGNWFRINGINISIYSCIYVAAMIAIHCYFYYISKKQADTINNLLQDIKGSEYNGGSNKI